jgi:hypothetical protein
LQKAIARGAKQGTNHGTKRKPLIVIPSTTAPSSDHDDDGESVPESSHPSPSEYDPADRDWFTFQEAQESETEIRPIVDNGESSLLFKPTANNPIGSTTYETISESLPDLPPPRRVNKGQGKVSQSQSQVELPDQTSKKRAHSPTPVVSLFCQLPAH